MDLINYLREFMDGYWHSNFRWSEDWSLQVVLMAHGVLTAVLFVETGQAFVNRIHLLNFVISDVQNHYFSAICCGILRVELNAITFANAVFPVPKIHATVRVKAKSNTVLLIVGIHPKMYFNFITHSSMNCPPNTLPLSVLQPSFKKLFLSPFI